MTSANDNDDNGGNSNGMIPALVFGASGEQGRAVLEGLVDCGRYSPIYGFTSQRSVFPPDNNNSSDDNSVYLRDALGVQLWQGDVANPRDVNRVLVETCARAIFFVTTTDLPDTTTHSLQTEGSSKTAMEDEYDTIRLFFDTLVQVYQQDGIERHVIFSTKDNVQRMYYELQQQKEQQQQKQPSEGYESLLLNIIPMDDGSIVPHYSAKGQGAEYALTLLAAAAAAADDNHNHSNTQEKGLTLTLLTLPFTYSNFLGFFTPLPVKEEEEGEEELLLQERQTDNYTNRKVNPQWQISASLGDGATKLDMMSVTDLAVVVPHILEDPTRYKNKNIRLSAGKISMDEIAANFSDLFGKDVIYNPLLPEELAKLPFPSAHAMAQMCQYLSYAAVALPYDESITQELMMTAATSSPSPPQQQQLKEHHHHYQRHAQTFQDWLLTHSDSSAFCRVGLDLDAPDITSVVVFEAASSAQGKSVVRGLLQDTRKLYTIRVTTTQYDDNSSSAAMKKAMELVDLDPDRVSVVHADLDDIHSCQKAADGMDGAFLVTDFYYDNVNSDENKNNRIKNSNLQVKERHTKNVIDACAASSTIKHLVFSTMANVEALHHVMDLGLDPTESNNNVTEIKMEAKAKAAAYARSKQLSVTFVIMPCYSEMLLDMIQRRPVEEGEGEEETTKATTTTSINKDDGDRCAQNKEKLVLTIPLKNSDDKVMCMSVDDLGPAVATIFDSYQVYAGHEIGLVTDFVTVSAIRDAFNAVIMEETESTTTNTTATEDGTKAISSSRVIETQIVTQNDWNSMQEQDTYMKDLGQMFAYMSHTDLVKKRHSLARTMKLVPSAKPLKLWVEQNKEDPSFREKLGLR